MAKIEYDHDKELTQMVADMIDDPTYSEFNNIRELGVTILPCVCIRMDDDGESQPCKGNPVTIKKVSAAERLFMKQAPHFLMIVDYHVWNNVGDNVRKPLLHSGLMDVKVEKSEQGTKIGKQKPDIVLHTRTIERFGAYTDSLLNCREAFRNSVHRILPSMEPEEADEPPPEEEETVSNPVHNSEEPEETT